MNTLVCLYYSKIIPFHALIGMGLRRKFIFESIYLRVFFWCTTIATYLITVLSNPFTEKTGPNRDTHISMRNPDDFKTVYLKNFQVVLCNVMSFSWKFILFLMFCIFKVRPNCHWHVWRRSPRRRSSGHIRDVWHAGSGTITNCQSFFFYS